MLISIDEYLKENNVPNMSLEELISFRGTLYQEMEHYENERNSKQYMDMERGMNPSPFVCYTWKLCCFIEVCRMIERKIEESLRDDLHEKDLERIIETVTLGEPNKRYTIKDLYKEIEENGFARAVLKRYPLMRANEKIPLEIADETMNIPLEELDLSVRAYNQLRRARCAIVKDVMEPGCRISPYPLREFFLALTKGLQYQKLNEKEKVLMIKEIVEANEYE